MFVIITYKNGHITGYRDVTRITEAYNTTAKRITIVLQIKFVSSVQFFRDEIGRMEVDVNQ